MSTGIAAFALVATLLAPSVATACASCACGDTTLTAMGLEKGYPHRVRLGFDMAFSGHSVGQGIIEDRVYTLRDSLTLSWSPTAWLTAVATLPLVSAWLLPALWPSERYTGLGDAETSVRFAVYRDRSFSPRHVLSLLAGLKMPTSVLLRDSHGQPFAPDDQPGTASWDPFAGVAYGWFGAGAAFFASVGYRHPTPGRDGYQRGQQVGATATVQVPAHPKVSVALGLEFGWSQRDRYSPDAPMADSGGYLVALSPALVVSPVQDWLIKLSGQLPIGEWLYGVQYQTPAVTLSTVVDVH